MAKIIINFSQERHCLFEKLLNYLEKLYCRSFEYFHSLRLHANMSIVSVEVFDVDPGVSLCKLSREYLFLWVINRSLYGNTNTSTLPVCTNKSTHDKSLHNK